MSLSKQSKYFIAIAHAADAFDALLLRAKRMQPPSAELMRDLRRQLLAVIDAAKAMEKKRC